MEIKIKAYAYTIDIITEIRYFCKCNNAVFGKFRFIFTCAISKTDCSLHHNFHALFKISGNGKFVRTAVLTPHPSRNLRKSTPRPRTAPPHQPFQKPHYPSPRTTTLASPRKRGGGTADIIFWPAVQYSDSPTFMILKLFRAVTVGIAPHPHHQ